MAEPSRQLASAPHPADRHRDPATVARVTALAGEILSRHGADVRTARRAHGWSNMTWLAGGFAVRVAASPGDEDLHREARLAALLPPEVGYPPVVDSGVAEGHAWVLSREVPGENLSAAWNSLAWEERAGAMVGLWQKAEAAHAVSGAQVGVHVRPVSPFYPAGVGGADAQVRRLEARGVLGPASAAVVRSVLARFWPALADGPRVLNHGDLARLNALWHDGHVSCLLDFEFALIAPVELDANEVLKSVLGPVDQADPVPDPDGVGRRLLQESVRRAVLPSLRHPGAADRLLGYAVLLEMWDVENELKHWDGREDFRTRRPYRRLAALASGDGGYLAPVLSLLP